MFGLKNKYYCLVASLKEYGFDLESKSAPFPSEIRKEISAEVSDSDNESVELLYLFYDIENIINAISGKTFLFNPLGNLTKEEIEAELAFQNESEPDNKYQSKLPKDISSIIYFFVKNQEFGADEVEKLHTKLLYTYYALASDSTSKFLRLWSASDKAMRNIIAISSARLQGLDPAAVVVGDGELEQSMVSSKAADFGMAADFEWYEELLSTLQIEDFIVREKKLDTLRWKVVESLIDQEYFTIDYLLGYLVHLNILARWNIMDKQTGDKRFREMVSSFTEGINLDK